MNYLTKGKVTAYLAFIFVAGGVTGAVITFQTARDRESRPPSTENVCTRIQDRFKAKLGLSEDQVKKLQPIFDQTAQELQAVRCKAIHETDAILSRAHDQVALELSPEQKRKLEDCERERQELVRRRLTGQVGKEKAP